MLLLVHKQVRDIELLRINRKKKKRTPPLPKNIYTGL